MAKSKSNDTPARKRYKSESRSLKNKRKKLQKRIDHLTAQKERAVRLNKYTKVDKAIAEVQAKLAKL